MGASRVISENKQAPRVVDYKQGQPHVVNVSVGQAYEVSRSVVASENVRITENALPIKEQRNSYVAREHNTHVNSYAQKAIIN